MPSKRPMSVVAEIVALLTELGPMTAREIAEQKNVSYSYGRAIVSHCKQHKSIYVKEYRRDTAEGSTLYPRAVYDVGNLPDAKKLKALPEREYRRRHRENKKRTVASVFAMAVPVEHRRLTNRKRPDVTARHEKNRQAALGSAE